MDQYMLTCIGKQLILLLSSKVPGFLTGTCEDLPSITNGVIAYSSTSPPRTDGSTATYSCGMGFLLRGDNMRTCQPDRSWSGTEPFCQSQFSHMCYFLPTFIGIAKTVHESIPYSG